MGVFDFDQEDELSVDVNNGKENKDKTDDESKAKLGAEHARLPGGDFG